MSKRDKILKSIDQLIQQTREDCKFYRGTSKPNAVILCGMYSDREDMLETLKARIEDIIDGL